MEHEFTTVLIWAIIVTISLGILVTLVIKLRKKHDTDMQTMEERLEKSMAKH